MKKNVCPYCGEKISTWKKWQLTDNRFGRKCPGCDEIIVLPGWYVKFTYVFNLLGIVVMYFVTRGITDNRFLILLLGAVALIGLNVFIIQSVSIKKPDKTK